MWLMFLKSYGRVLASAALVAALFVLYSCQMHKAEQRGYARATAEMQARIEVGNAKAAVIELQQRRQSARAAAQWETDRNALQSQVDQLLTRRVSVRVCKPATARAATLPRTTEPTGQPHDAAASGVDAVQVGPDVGDRVVQLAGEC